MPGQRIAVVESIREEQPERTAVVEHIREKQLERKEVLHGADRCGGTEDGDAEPRSPIDALVLVSSLRLLARPRSPSWARNLFIHE